jgi:hypothetical protein
VVSIDAAATDTGWSQVRYFLRVTGRFQA